MTKDELLELADRVEAATGPDRELDRAIRDTLNLAHDYGADWGSRGRDIAQAFPYTASLDAAMTLVPEEVFWRLGHDGEGPDPSQFRAEMLMVFSRSSHSAVAVAATPALALTAAALRALANDHSKEG